MANRLTMAQVSTIRTLHQSGHSNREIVRLVGVHRETVAKYVGDDESKPAQPDDRVASGPKNCCKPYRDIITGKLDQGLSGARIYQDLRDDHGFSASYSSVRRFIRACERRIRFRFAESRWNPARKPGRFRQRRAGDRCRWQAVPTVDVPQS